MTKFIDDLVKATGTQKSNIDIANLWRDFSLADNRGIDDFLVTVRD